MARFSAAVSHLHRFQRTADSRKTSITLERLGVPYFIVIEPQEYDEYSCVIDDEKISIPVPNHGDGPGRARNRCWDHSISLGAKRHWVLDDNISRFLRSTKTKDYQLLMEVYSKRQKISWIDLPMLGLRALTIVFLLLPVKPIHHLNSMSASIPAYGLTIAVGIVGGGDTTKTPF